MFSAPPGAVVIVYSSEAGTPQAAWTAQAVSRSWSDVEFGVARRTVKRHFRYDDCVAEVVNTRQHQRVVFDAFVKIEGRGSEQLFRTRDVSLSGLFLSTQVGQLYDFRVGSTLEIELLGGSGGQSLHARVVVVRIVEMEVGADGGVGTAPTGFGCRFLDLSPEDREVLAKMIGAKLED